MYINRVSGYFYENSKQRFDIKGLSDNKLLASFMLENVKYIVWRKDVVTGGGES